MVQSGCSIRTDYPTGPKCASSKQNDMITFLLLDNLPKEQINVQFNSPTGDGSMSVSLANSSSSSATLLSAARSEISGQGNEAQVEVNGHGMVLINIQNVNTAYSW